MKALAALVLVAGVIVFGASPASADPPRPTDYRTDVVRIDPPIPGLAVRVIGGDSFIELDAPPGVTVVVTGYRGEPFARFLPDGTVEADHASYTWATSLSRYGSNPAAEPLSVTDWRVVARDGSWAWHDHRSHWMSGERPLGRSPGQQVLEGVIPLTVDGVPAAVQLSTFWVIGPARWPAFVAGTLTAAALLFGAWWFWRRPRFDERAAPALAATRTVAATRAAGATLAVAATLALVVGLGTSSGMPPEAGVSPLHWILPTLALAAAIIGVVSARRPARRDAALLLGALALLQWVWRRRDVFTKPILPTTLAPTADRVLTAVVLVAAAAVVGGAGWAFLRSTFPTPSDRDHVATVGT